MTHPQHGSAEPATPAALHSEDAIGPIVVVMGVPGSGKSAVGPIRAAMLAVPFLDADDYHDRENIERMRAGIPRDDADRQPWLDRLHQILAAHTECGLVLACSALKRAYRGRLRGN